MRVLIVISLTLAAFSVQAQMPVSGKEKAIGFELDALPYLMKGYYGSVWLGQGHFRYRAIVTHLTNPSFLVADGFRKNTIQSYTMLSDYFFSQGFEKWWVGAGVEYWRGCVRREEVEGRARYDNVIATDGGGYVWRFYRHFYLNPWCALHVRIAGDSHVDVNGATFRPAVVTPEASVKLGCFFSCRK